MALRMKKSVMRTLGANKKAAPSKIAKAHLPKDISFECSEKKTPSGYAKSVLLKDKRDTKSKAAASTSFTYFCAWTSKVANAVAMLSKKIFC